MKRSALYKGTVKYKNYLPHLGEQQGPAGKPFRVLFPSHRPQTVGWSTLISPSG